MAVPKSEFTYFHYGNESYLDGLEAFCAPYEVKKTLSDIKDDLIQKHFSFQETVHKSGKADFSLGGSAFLFSHQMRHFLEAEFLSKVQSSDPLLQYC